MHRAWLAALLVLLWTASVGASPKLLIIGLDSGDWDYLDPLMASGYTPTIASLVGSGVKADYDCTLAQPSINCFCPMVWTSVYTGWPSLVHGISNNNIPPVERKVPAIWNVLRDQRPGAASLLAAAHTHTPPLPEATWISTRDSALAAADERYVLSAANLPPDFGDPTKGAIPSWLYEGLGILPHSGPTPTVWTNFGSDRVTMEVLRRVAAQGETPALTVAIFHSLDKTMHYECAAVMAGPSEPVDEAELLALAGAWTGPVEGDLNLGTAASQYLEADLHIGELLTIGSWDYVMITSDHGMIRDPEAATPCHHLQPQAFDGIFALTGPGVRTGVELPTEDPLCTAPLAAYLMGLSISLELPCVASGRFEASLLPAIFEPAHLAANPPTFTAQWQLPALQRIPVLPRLGLFALGLLLFWGWYHRIVASRGGSDEL